MRITLPLASLAGLTLWLAAALAARPARADGVAVAGVYEVEYKELSTNCTQARLAYAPGKLTVRARGSQLVVDIDRTPEMLGALARNGKISAKSRSGSTMVEGMKGVFSVAGRVTPEGILYLVMVGEYSAGGRALCTQSWNVTGPRLESAERKGPGAAEKPAP
jgi:hypothetical protein